MIAFGFRPPGRFPKLIFSECKHMTADPTRYIASNHRSIWFDLALDTAKLCFIGMLIVTAVAI